MSAPRRNVAFNKPEEPSFLKAFKAKVGYKEPVSIEAKRELPPDSSAAAQGGEEKEDELPTVVVLRRGDVTAEEYQEFRRSRKDDESHPEAEDPTAEPLGPSRADAETEGDDGKIVFKKPSKRKSSEGGGGGVLDASTKRSKTDEDSKSSHKTTPRSQAKAKGVKNSNLLSFGEEEEEVT